MSRNRRSRDRGYISGNRIIAAPTYDEVLFNYLVVAGGGGGGRSGGGGGAGGLRSTVTTTGGGGTLETPITLLTSNSYSVTVGAGGAGNNVDGSFGNTGSDSVFSSIVSTGGGGGGSYSSNGQIGGSGGGGGTFDSGVKTGGAGTLNQGYAGGNGSGLSGASRSSGGGGGVGAVGANATAGIGGNGGAGVAVSITGSSVTYGGGGGGSAATTAGAGGTGGGGAGGNNAGTSVAGTANTGGGGGGQRDSSGVAGGSGVVILRYSNLYTLNIGAGLSYSTQTVNDDKVTTFTGGSGSISLSPAPVTTGDYESIATVLVGSGGASTLTFSNIPQTYKHLQIRMINRVVGNSGGNTNSNVLIRFNSDTASNYTRHLLYDQGGIGSAGTANNTSIFASAAPNSTNTSGIFGAAVVDILDYANTNKFKTTRALGGYDNNGVAGNRLNLESGVWRDTSAITTILIYPDNTETWAQHSHFALYGIRG